MLPLLRSRLWFLCLAANLLVHTAQAWKTFTVPHTDDSSDDTPALQAVLNEYSTDSTILFEKGVYYNIFTPIVFPKLQNVEIRIEGNLTYPTDMATVQGAHTLFELVLPVLTWTGAAIVASPSFTGHWFSFAGGNNVSLIGSTDPKWGWVDAHGQQWWDKRELTNRPHGWAFQKITNGIIRNMKLWKPIAWSFSTSGSTNVRVYNNWIYAISDDMDKAFPFNTDGFSAGGTNLLFENNHIQNGDDCLTVGNGAKNIIFRNTRCEGGHGLSIGSLGKNGQVADVQNIFITWKNIRFEKVAFPLGPKPDAPNQNSTHLEDITFENFIGTIDEYDHVLRLDRDKRTNLGATGKEVIIFDLYPNTVKNIVARRIAPSTLSGAPPAVMCDPTILKEDVGFQCVNGPFSRTPGGSGKQ
ncbi:hypothetical protein MD484_g6570, partial [Candolleomyces efflorescens]